LRVPRKATPNVWSFTLLASPLVYFKIQDERPNLTDLLNDILFPTYFDWWVLLLFVDFDWWVTPRYHQTQGVPLRTHDAHLFALIS